MTFPNSGIGGGIGPLTYYWQPKTYLSDPDSLVTWCKPDSSIQYKEFAIDSCGCVSYIETVYDIRVLPKKNSLLEADKTWVFLLAGDYPNPEIYGDLCYKIGNDTIIGEVVYKKLLFSEGCDKYDGIRGFIRETEEGKIYFMENKLQMEEEFLLYDFGMHDGDSAKMGWENSFYLLDSIKLNSDEKKLYYLSKSTGYKDIWIEGVGSEMGLLREQITGGSMMFSCCFLNDKQLYHNTGFAGCFFVPDSSLPDSVTGLLVGVWSWYDSGGGLAGNGFGGPKENGYSVNVKIEKDLFSDSLVFWDYVSDSLVRQGKATAHFYEKDSSVFEINSVLPTVHDSYFVYPFDTDRMIHFEFTDKDTIRFYHAMCADCFEVYYKRDKNLGVEQNQQMESELKFFPNPANDFITISNPSNIAIKTIELTDFSGRIVQTWRAQELVENTLNIQYIPPGIYLLKATTEAGVKTEKLVVQ